jgi:cystathionine gamma-lyase
MASSSSDTATLRFETRAIHAHQPPCPVTGAVVPPLYQTSTFAQQDAGVNQGYDYTRTGNPTVNMLADVVANLEGGTFGTVYTTGVAALSTLMMALVKPGDHLIVSDNVYGGTYRFLTKIYQQHGIDLQFVDMTDLANIHAAIKPNTRMIYMESPTNPLLKLVDIAGVAAMAKPKGILTAIDNTFATPVLQLPMSLGVDVVLHSLTKYMSGHSDVLGGALVTNSAELAEVIRFHQYSMGGTMDPFAAWLILRGVRTLPLRMRQHCQNALALAQFLESHPCVEEVIYPGLPSHPQHALQQKQMCAGGGMIAIRVKGTQAEARKLMQACQVFTLAESLGGVESLIEHPWIMTHASMTPEAKNAIGITENLLRLSVGIEALDDLQADLDQALKSACAKVAVGV